MIKRWGHIFLTIWLINSVVWFQVPTSLAFNENYSDESQECLVEMSSLLCTAAHLLDVDGGNAPDHGGGHKIKYRNHFITNRVSIPATVFVAQTIPFSFSNIPTTIKLYVGKYRTVSAFLPDYYSFLFRLSPF